MHPDEEGTLRLYKSVDRTANAVWNIASEAGLRVGVVNWLNTYPPEIIDGVMISDFAIPGQRQARRGLGARWAEAASDGAQTALPADRSTEGTTYPAEWTQKLEELAAAEPADPFTRFHAGLREYFQIILLRAYVTDSLVVRTALEVDRELRPD